jgi:SAM-dependent methyltransferase
VAAADPETERARLAEQWEQSAGGWGKAADQIRNFGMPVSRWLIDHLDLQPGERVLELAAGPGDTGFMAAELIQPGGTLTSSDGAEGMLAVARERAEALGITNVEFKQLGLEWIDLPTASVDAVLCRWGIMLIVDPEAAAREIRRVLKPGGRAALAVWDVPDANPWATTPGRALIKLGHSEPPDPEAPGMFALAAPGKLQELLESAGFTDVMVDSVELPRDHPSIDDYLADTKNLSGVFRGALDELSDGQRAEVDRTVAAIAGPYMNEDGSVHFTGSSLVVLARA